MLLYLLDRVGTPTCVFGVLAWGSWQLREHINLSLAYGILAVATLWYCNLVFTAVSREAKLARLGARAPSVRTWTPYNLGFIYNAVWYMLRHRNHEFWASLFSRTRKDESKNFTIESIMMGERIILTADEENIKAILATQFGSYGKGPQFRKEWKDFLGLSIVCSIRHILQSL